MRQILLYLSIVLLTACASARIVNLPAPLLSQPHEFRTIGACEAQLSALFAEESTKKERGEPYVELDGTHCEQKGATVGNVAGGFLILVLGAVTGAALYLDTKY